MGTYGVLEAAGPVLDALGDPTRRAILETLRRGGPSSVSALAERIPVSRPAISQHLKVLGAVGLVDHESRGTRNIYRVDRTGLDELRDWLDQFWSDALDAYADHIRRTDAEHADVRVRRTEVRRTDERESETGQADEPAGEHRRTDERRGGAGHSDDVPRPGKR